MMLWAFLVLIISDFTNTSSSSSTNFNTNYSSLSTASSSQQSRPTLSLPNFAIFFCLFVPPKHVEFPLPGRDYKDQLTQDIEEYKSNVSDRLNVDLSIEAARYYSCQTVHAALLECFAKYFDKLGTINSMVIVGPLLCNTFTYEHSMIRLRRYVSEVLNNSMDVAIITSDPNIMPLTSLIDRNKSPDLFDQGDPRTLMSVGGTVFRDSQAIWHLLTAHFRYRHVSLITMGRRNSRRLHYCEVLNAMLLYQANINAYRMYFEAYKWIFNGDMSDYNRFEEVWTTVKKFTRILLVCAPAVQALNVVRFTQADKTRSNKYGVILIMRSNDLLNHYMEELKQNGLLNALDFFKFLAPDLLTCNKTGNMSECLEDPLCTSAYNLTFEDREDLTELNTFYDNTKCAMHHYFVKAADVAEDGKENERLADAFADTYRPDLKTLVSRYGRAVEWLTVWKLYSANRDHTEILPVRRIDWIKTGNSTAINVSAIGQLLWYGKDAPLSDAPFVCKNVTRFFPCPREVVAGLTKEQMTVIVAGVIFSVALLIGMIYFTIHRYVRSGSKFLTDKFDKSDDKLEFNKNEKDSTKILIGKFGKQRHIFLSIKDQVQLTDAAQPLQLWALRDIAALWSAAESNGKTLQPLVGYVKYRSSPFHEVRLIFSLGLGVTLKRLLKSVKLSTDLKYSLARDLTTALNSIHNSRLNVHGDLSSTRCIVDERFVIRIILTGLHSAPFGVRRAHKGGLQHQRCAHLLWTAPEQLRDPSLNPTQASDVYSLGIVFHEITYQRGPFYVEHIQGLKHHSKALTKDHQNLIEADMSEKSSQLSNDESCAELIVKQLKVGNLRPTVRRLVQRKINFLEDLMEKCWKERPTDRPKIDTVLKVLEDYMKTNQIDVAFKTAKRLTQASKQMVKGLLDGKREAVEERDRSVKYLMHMMPASFGYEFMTAARTKDPQTCRMVTIYFNDLAEFQLINKPSVEVVSILNELYQIYDRTVALYDVMPLHRVGTSLLLASGVPEPTTFHASEIALAALHIRYLAKLYTRMALRLKAGIHSGEVMCGMVGKNIPQFGLFGDTVNTASRMMSTGTLNEIQMTLDTRAFLSKNTNFEIVVGEEREIKGKGKMKTCWLKNYKGSAEYVSVQQRRLDGRSAQCDRSVRSMRKESKMSAPTFCAKFPGSVTELSRSSTESGASQKTLLNVLPSKILK